MRTLSVYFVPGKSLAIGRFSKAEKVAIVAARDFGHPLPEGALVFENEAQLADLLDQHNTPTVPPSVGHTIVQSLKSFKREATAVLGEHQTGFDLFIHNDSIKNLSPLVALPVYCHWHDDAKEHQSIIADRFTGVEHT